MSIVRNSTRALDHTHPHHIPEADSIYYLPLMALSTYQNSWVYDEQFKFTPNAIVRMILPEKDVQYDALIYPVYPTAVTTL